VVDLEIDDPTRAGPVLDGLFPEGPPPTLGWSSPRGEHRLYLLDQRLAGARSAVVHLASGAVELRLGADGKQLAAVCPPSPGTDGRPRRWNGVWEIAPCPGALVALAMELDGSRTPCSRAVRVGTSRPQIASARYALAALERESSLVRSAGPGTRNASLNLAAFRLGQLVGSGAIERTTVEEALAEAALEAGLGELEVARTIRSGLEAGLEHPRGPGAGR
jgi:hypothetical protein